MKNRFYKVVLLLFLCLNYFSTYALTAPVQDTFITIADIHFDPLETCHLNKDSSGLLNKLESSSYQQWESILEKEGNRSLCYYRDTNYFLLKNILSKLNHINEQYHPKFVLLLGDFLPHQFKKHYKKYSIHYSDLHYKAFVKKTIQFLTYEIEKTFPGINIYPLIGNNDSYDRNYSVVPNGEFLADTMKTWAIFIKNPRNLASFQSTFNKAGYYEVMVPDSSNKIILLDTVLFSSKQNNNPMMKQAAFAELEWLQKKLDQAKQQHQKVLLAYHIPDGIDVFAMMWNKSNPKEFWQSVYNRKFEEIVGKYSETITALFPAHIHRDFIPIPVLNKQADIPVNFTPSISPVYGNAPAFKLFSYNPATLKVEQIERWEYKLLLKMWETN